MLGQCNRMRAVLVVRQVGVLVRLVMQAGFADAVYPRQATGSSRLLEHNQVQLRTAEDMILWMSVMCVSIASDRVSTYRCRYVVVGGYRVIGR